MLRSCICSVNNVATRAKVVLMGSRYGLQRRMFTSTIPVQDKTSDPFRVLGVPSNSPFTLVKDAFVRLAMTNHPDRGGKSEDFIRLRNAFEAILETEMSVKPISQNDLSSNGNDGSFDVRSQHNEIPPDHDWQAWFHHRTGLNLAFEMSDCQRREMIHVYRTMEQGGKDKGGYWELARQLAVHEDLGDKRPISSALAIPVAPDNGAVSKRRKRRR